MEIRPATPHDCSNIARIQVDSYLTAYAPILPIAYGMLLVEKPWENNRDFGVKYTKWPMAGKIYAA